MGAWRRPGLHGGGLQERHVHRKLLCGSLSVLLAALQWRPYHHNGHEGEDTTREHTQHIAERAMSDYVRANLEKKTYLSSVFFTVWFVFHFLFIPLQCHQKFFISPK